MPDDLEHTIEDIIAAASNWLETHCGDPVPDDWTEAYRAIRALPHLMELQRRIGEMLKCE